MHATARRMYYNVLTTKAAQMFILPQVLFDGLDAVLATMPVPNAEEQAYIDAGLAHMEAHPLTDSEMDALNEKLVRFQGGERGVFEE